MRGQSVDKVASVESFFYNRVEQQHDVAHLILHSQVDDTKIVVGIQLVKVLDNLLISNVALAETCCLIEYGQSIAHATISLFGNNAKRLLFVFNTLLIGHVL